ncbi:MAG: PHP domain-containing protein [Anaerolineae bacterium]|nr:PHP domain-containing protein [Anaerolineae bacterium]
MRALAVDLHIHTVLSACAAVEMIPPLIVRRALELGLDVIAITDHNSAANAGAVIEAARGTGLTVLPGMEVQTREEVHMLCLYDTLEQADAWASRVADALPDARNREEFFGAQYVVDASGAHLYTEERLLATSTAMSVEQVASGVEALGGLCLAAHVDRPSFSILSNLGFIPPSLPIDGIEISPRSLGLAKIVLERRQCAEKRPSVLSEDGFSSQGPFSQRVVPGEREPGYRLTENRKLVELLVGLVSYGVIVNSDAHYLADMGTYCKVRVTAPTVPELRLALSGQQGRSVALCDN